MQNEWSLEKYCSTFCEELINGGSYGKVFKALNQGNRYAIKKIPFELNDKEEKLKEVRVLIDLQCTFVIDYFNHWNVRNYYIPHTFNNANLQEIGSGNHLRNPNCDYILHIQMQYCVMTLRNAINNLSQYINLIREESTRLTNTGYSIASQLFIQLVKGINFLHENLIVHLDLKPENILISLDNDLNFVKIADFGNAMKEEDRLLPSNWGTPNYIAPELKAGRFDRRSDLYSLGKIAQELFYINPNETDFYAEIMGVVTMIQKLKSRIPNARGLCGDILESKFINDNLLIAEPEVNLHDFFVRCID